MIKFLDQRDFEENVKINGKKFEVIKKFRQIQEKNSDAYDIPVIFINKQLFTVTSQ